MLRESGRDETVGGGEVLDIDPITKASKARPGRSIERVVAERGGADTDIQPCRALAHRLRGGDDDAVLQESRRRIVEERRNAENVHARSPRSRRLVVERPCLRRKRESQA